MIRLGRGLTIMGVTWAVIGLLLIGVAPTLSAVNNNSILRIVLFLAGLVGTLSIFGAWGLALYHWGTGTSGGQHQKGRWGLFLIVFAFVAAWVYWFTRPPDHETIQLTLEYTGEPQSGGYGLYPVAPNYTTELALAIRDHPELAADGDAPFPENPTQFQVHLFGTSRALEELGRFLIALARSGTKDPEPYGSLDDVRNVDGGTVRLLPRRVEVPVSLVPASQNAGPWPPRRP